VSGRPFQRLAIVNRGEAAMRAINAVRELNAERSDPIAVIALYTEPERHSLFVRQADEAYCIGPALIGDGDERRSAYLDYERLERALVEMRADAAWVGWGFVAEQPGFAELCERLGIVFAGPAPDVMRALGDKIGAKRLAEEAGVPVAPWSGGPVESVEEARAVGERLGFPLMIKATAGGGGRGMRRVDAADELETAFERARAEAAQAFGDPSVLMEQLVGAARHVEVQLMADGEGGVWALGVRDCSYQRRHQKVLEESASPALAPEQERELAESAVRLARSAGYRGAGTAEFLYEPESRRFSFMEVNARLQVEHPVTELVTGADLVRMQLEVAAGGRLEGDPPPPRGHAIEVRLNAEDPARGFAPAPGRITLLRFPGGPGIRVDSGFAEGDTVSPEFDSMIAKVIAYGSTREQAIGRLRRAVADMLVALDEGTTNQGFLLELLNRRELLAGEVDTGWLDRLQAQGDVEPTHNADAALIRAGIALCDAATAAERGRFYALARRGRPNTEAEVGCRLDLLHRGTSYRLFVCQTGPRNYLVEIDGARIEAVIDQLSAHESRLRFDGRSHRTMTALQDQDLLVEVDGVAHRIARDEGGLVRSQAPGVVVAVTVAAGDEVSAGEVVAVTESMKMELSLTAPVDGRVREVLVAANEQVGAGRPLLQIDPLSDTPAAEAAGERLEFADAPTDDDGHQRLEWLVLGYDVPGSEVRAIVEGILAAPPDHEREHRLLETYADVRALGRPHPEPGDEADVMGSPQEHLHAFLRSLDPESEGLPERFVGHLEAALAHYGIADTDRTAALEDAGYRLFLAQRRAAPARSAVERILTRRLEQPGDADGADLRSVLDRLETTLARREPDVADLARELRWRACDEPLVQAAREEVTASMEQHLAALTEDPARADRDERIEALVACPQPLAPLLSRLAGSAGPLIEAMTRRYYRIRPLDKVEQRLVAGVPFVLAGYERDDVRYHVAATLGDADALPRALRAASEHALSLPAGEPLLLDLYARDDVAAELERALAEAELPRALERVVLVHSAEDVRTYGRAGDDSFAEDADVRGLHPMMAERLELWRLSNFELERLSAAPDVHLFRAVAHENERDVRLVALAEVRGLTPVRADDGRITALPELERMVQQVFEAVRSAQSGLPARRRLMWNRVQLYVWPTIDFRPEEAGAIVARFARETAGLGLELVMIRVRLRDPDGVERNRMLRMFNPAGQGVVLEITDLPAEPLQPLDEGAQRIVSARRRGTLHPAEIVKVLAPQRAAPGAVIPAGEFVEHDLDDDGELVAVDRRPGTNAASVVVGLIRNRTERYPEGMLRVALFGDPTRALGSLAEPECRRVIAALDLAQGLAVPVEWFALSSGAKIAMDSGTENMDWVAAALRRIVTFTQAGGEINVIVSGINVGAQPYFNAEATMLMHTRGILVMTPDSAMVLTGKQALDYSGGVSAEDNFGIGGFDRVMGPNGQAQYWAADIAGACGVLLRHYEHTYVAPGERFPRRAASSDPPDRDVSSATHHAPGSDLETVGAIFSEKTNPGRKKPFDIRSVMRAVADADTEPLERWAGMREAEVAVVWDARLGGRPVALLGIESRPLTRYGSVPADGPEQWTSGTLFPAASKKLARAINAASGRRPLVVLANLAGFDGSPESMRRLQLEYGAEIGRAIVNFDGPIAFCVISRFHGGAFVVFSRRLNDGLETIALEGAHASVIGGAPAAAVVFAREVDARTRRDPRIAELDERIEAAAPGERGRLRAERDALWAEVRSERLGELAAEFDSIHSVTRAVEVGSVDRVIPASALRADLIDTIERGIARAEARAADGGGEQPVQVAEAQL
jgi:acetyl/propionyl-CoA carboxylase alpha subunit/acetyl-CoA carboxylase carboxyltransferase component